LFVVGAGLDWFDDRGLTAALRLRADHLLGTSASLDAGWLGSGLLTNRGFPLGFALGPAVGLDSDLKPRVGGRARITVALWYQRATLEFDLTSWRTIDSNDPRPLVEYVGAIQLRVAPWSPWRL
jgi:hypothetical protein